MLTHLKIHTLKMENTNNKKKDENIGLEQRIIYAHAMHLSKVDRLSPELIDHVWKNKESREGIAALYELLDVELVKKQPHPYLKKI